VTRRYPRKSTKVSEARYYFIQRFKSATQVLKYASGEDVAAADALSKNTPFLTRDILMKAASGNLITMVTNDGRTWMGAMEANSQIQTLLDAITFEPGAILVRTPAGWLGLEPPTAIQQFLGFDLSVGYPQWMDGGGGGGDPDYMIPLAADFPTAFGTATITDTAHGMCITSAAVGSPQLHGYAQPVGSADFDLYTRLVNSNFWDNYNGACVAIGDSASGKWIIHNYQSTGGAGGVAQGMNVSQYNSITSYGSDAGGGLPAAGPSMWSKIHFDAASKRFSFYCSLDGENWRAQAINNAWLTNPDLIGYGVQADNGGVAPACCIAFSLRQ
jgi:hypothetical protein